MTNKFKKGDVVYCLYSSMAGRGLVIKPTTDWNGMIYDVYCFKKNKIVNVSECDMTKVEDDK